MLIAQSHILDFDAQTLNTESALIAEGYTVTSKIAKEDPRPELGGCQRACSGRFLETSSKQPT
jgi:hypothetical protein